MINQYLIKYGFTRDSLSWLYCQAIGISTLIVVNVGNLPAWAAYIGIPLTDMSVHRLSVIAAVILYFGGKYGTSPLPGAPK